jgi:uncharacterized protein YjiS (DUF1127 family)
VNIISTLLRRSARRRAYAELLRLDDHLLRDVGLNRSDLRTAMIAGDVAGLTMSRAHA